MGLLCCKEYPIDDLEISLSSKISYASIIGKPFENNPGYFYRMNVHRLDFTNIVNHIFKSQSLNDHHKDKLIFILDYYEENRDDLHVDHMDFLLFRDNYIPLLQIYNKNGIVMRKINNYMSDMTCSIIINLQNII